MKKIHLKFKALERSQHFSHYKSMGIFSDAQGQVTYKSLIGSCQISNPSEILWVSLLPARVVITLFIDFFRRSRAANSEVSDGILPKFKPSRFLRLTFTVSIHCAPEMSEIDCIGRIESIWPKFVRGW